MVKPGVFGGCGAASEDVCGASGVDVDASVCPGEASSGSGSQAWSNVFGSRASFWHAASSAPEASFWPAASSGAGWSWGAPGCGGGSCWCECAAWRGATCPSVGFCVGVTACVAIGNGVPLGIAVSVGFPVAVDVGIWLGIGVAWWWSSVGL